MVINTEEGTRYCVKFQDDLRRQFCTNFIVNMYRDPCNFKDIISIHFYDNKGNEHNVRQEHDLHSLWGYVGLEDETITKIMLLLG
jgi:hypothetical protein